jgi:hypothetical protein
MTGTGESMCALDELRSRYLYEYLHQPPTGESDIQLFRTILLDYAAGRAIDTPVQLGQIIHHPHPDKDVITHKGAQLVLMRTFTPGIAETRLAQLNPDGTALGYHTHTPYEIPASTAHRGFKRTMNQVLRHGTITTQDAQGVPDELRAANLTRHVARDDDLDNCDDLIYAVFDGIKRGQSQTNAIFDPECLSTLVKKYASGHGHYEYAYDITGSITVAFRGLLQVTSTQILQALNPSIDCNVPDDRPLSMTLFTTQPTTPSRQISEAPLEPPRKHAIHRTAEGRLITGIPPALAYTLIASQVEWTDITPGFLRDNEPGIISTMNPGHPKPGEIIEASRAALRKPAALPPPIEGIPEITRQLLKVNPTHF